MKFKMLSAAFLAGLVFTASAFAAPAGWTEDFAAAQKQAAAENKDLLLEFTGSDWCAPCIALKREVFDQPAFGESVPKNFVLVKLDFPNRIPQSDELVAQNQRLQEKYAIQGYPTVILADAAGKPYAQTGYQPGGAEAYVAHLEELRANKAVRDEALSAAESAEGLDKARALDVAVSAIGLELAVNHYGDLIQQIVALDPEDAAGLKTKYENLQSAGEIDQQMQAAFGLLEQQKYDEGLAELDRVISDYNLGGERKQVILTIKGQVY
ncbi:MAG: thioredoxin family protein, partial [Planctomycetota bacterium]